MEEEKRKVMKKQKQKSQNYLTRCPMRPAGIEWSADAEGMVTLFIENKGFYHGVAQKLFKKPKVSQVHLDRMGSFVWPLLDGQRDITALGVLVKGHFGEEAEPLYERLAKFFQILDSYSLVYWKQEDM